MGADRHVQDRLFIGGRWVEPIDGDLVDSIDPSTGRAWATVAFGGAADVDRAVEAAGTALGPWQKMSVFDRAAALRNFATVYASHAPRLAELESRDNGRPIRETRPDVAAHAQWYHYYAALADKLDGRCIPVDPTVHVYTTRVPIGVVGAIVPWNAPLLLAAWKIAPALAAGCTIVLKPAEITSVTAFEIARIAEEAGLPPGVINIVPGRGDTVGARLVAHPDVPKITFTGSHETAQRIMRAGADGLKRVTFENGGKAPHIIFADADLDQALNAATHAAFMACGQSCALGSRLFVESSIYSEVVDALTRRAAQVRVGRPLDESTQMGPQASADQLEKTMGYIAAGEEDGAKLVAGGHCIGNAGFNGGYFVEPTVFAGVDNTMRIAREEIFGPVCSIIPFHDEDDVIAQANDSTYGLVAGLWTKDVGRAHRVANALEVGTVWVNTYRYIRWSIPYGGFKLSGVGRENGPEGLDAYLETRATVMSLTGSYPDMYPG